MTLQVALALAVLVGAGMMARSLEELRGVATGLNPENLLTMRVRLSEGFRESPSKQLQAFDEIRRRVASLPGVEGAAVISNLPVGGGASGTSLHAEGTVAPPPGQEPWVVNKQAHPGYFRTIGIPLVAGRDFTEADGAEGSPRVVVVNEAFARHYWPGEPALGKRIKYGRPDSEYPWMEVIGVSGDVRHFGPDSPVQLGLYEPLRTFPYWREHLVVRTSGTPESFIQPVLSQIRQVDGDAPVSDILSMREVLFRDYWRPVVLARILWVFSGVALLLASLGVYGVVAFSTAQRRREFGIRMALGAEEDTVLAQALRTTMAPSGLGLVVGLLVGWIGMRFAAGLLYGVDSLDPRVALASLFLMVLVAVTATLLPARKAARLDPAEVLRSD